MYLSNDCLSNKATSSMKAETIAMELVTVCLELSIQPVFNTYLAVEWMHELKGAIFSW